MFFLETGFCTENCIDFLGSFWHYAGEFGVPQRHMKIFTWKQRAVVLAVTLGMVGLFVLTGWGIGHLVGQTKAGIFIAVLISYPFTQWALAKSILKVHEAETRDEA